MKYTVSNVCLSFDFKWYTVYFDASAPSPTPLQWNFFFFYACTYTIYACWWSFSLYRSVNNWMFLPTSCARVSMSQRTYACIVSQDSDTINFDQVVHVSIKAKWWLIVNLILFGSSFRGSFGCCSASWWSLVRPTK